LKVRLLEGEMQLLKALEKLNGEAYDERLVSETGWPSDKVTTMALNMSERGIVKVSVEEEVWIWLTDEGLRYARMGLPERRILEQAMARGGVEISKLEGVEDWEKPIGLAWLRKKGWGVIRGGRVEAAGEFPKGADEKLIELIASKGKVRLTELPEELRKTVKTLKSRRLVETGKVTRRLISLTELGWGVLRGDVEVLEEVSRLTRDLIVSGRWRSVVLKKYDVSLPSYRIPIGRLHFWREILNHIRRVWVEMGFKEMEGPILETCFWDYDALYVPQDHPARDLQDTFYVKTPGRGRLPSPELVDRVRRTHEDGWTTGSIGWGYEWDVEEAKRTLLRTHTTAVSVRTLAVLKGAELPAKFFSVGRVFRNEKPDRTHLCEFYQTEGIVVDENANMKHLVGYLREFFKRLGFPEARFRPAYFPYTEPSLEVEVYHPPTGRWIELGGAGIFRPEVVKPLLGRDIPVLAWGLGPERMVMLNYGLKDIRELVMNDLETLRRAPVWMG